MNTPLLDLLDAALGFHETLTALPVCELDGDTIKDATRAYTDLQGRLFHNSDEANEYSETEPQYQDIPFTITPINMLEDQQ